MASQNWWKIDHSRDKTKCHVFSISQLVEFSGGWKGPPLINSGALNDHNGWSLMVFDGSKQKNWNPWHSITKVSSVILFWLSREWKCKVQSAFPPHFSLRSGLDLFLVPLSQLVWEIQSLHTNRDTIFTASYEHCPFFQKYAPEQTIPT